MCVYLYEAFLSSDWLVQKKDESEPAIKWRKTWWWYRSLWFPCFLDGLHSHCNFHLSLLFCFLLVISHFTQYNECILCLDTWWIGGALLGQERFSESRCSIVGSSYILFTIKFSLYSASKNKVHGIQFRQGYFCKETSYWVLWFLLGFSCPVIYVALNSFGLCILFWVKLFKWCLLLNFFPIFLCPYFSMKRCN